MDERKPIWRTAWYWKKFGLYLFLPLNIVLAVFSALTRTGHLSEHQFDRITTVVASLGLVIFTMWINHRASKQIAQNHL